MTDKKEILAQLAKEWQEALAESDAPMLLTLADTRNALGATVRLDEEAVAHCIVDFDLKPNALHVEFILPTSEQVEQGWPGTFEWDFETDVLTIHLPVSDRLEFSDKALTRLTRSLAAVLHAARSQQVLRYQFGSQAAAVIWAMTLPVIFATAYQYGKAWAHAHEGLYLLKVAEEPVPDH